MPKDPLKEGTTGEKALFYEFSKLANGHPVEELLGACMNVIANAVRQTYGKRSEAEAHFNELFGRNKEMLLAHYDPNTGRRRSVIPFTQNISPAFLIDEDLLFNVKKPLTPL